MKKILLLLIISGLSLKSNAFIRIFNNSCLSVDVSVGCHDSNYPDCGAIRSYSITIAPGATTTISNTSTLGYCSAYSPFNPINPSYIPANTQNWDRVEFAITYLPHPTVFSVGICSFDQTSLNVSASNYGACSDFLYSWSQAAGNTYVSVSDI
jgi:hypothetical protein